MDVRGKLHVEITLAKLTIDFGQFLTELRYQFDINFFDYLEAQNETLM